MAETLYRKYRPQTFAEIVDQQHIRITLQNALTQGRVAHAYLFAGPRGVGKTTVARLLARAVNCQQPGKQGEPCNRCLTCTAMNEGRSLDIIEIDAASQTGVDNVRENIIQSARVVPSLGKFKVFIIDEVHMLSLAAFNALLKLLEEPPAHAMFILATTELHRVPETIISRTQRFDFRRLSASDIATRLEDLAKREARKLTDGVAERIARHAAGSLRDAESMLGQLFSFEEETIGAEIADLVLPRSNEAVALQLITALTNRQANEAFRLFHQFTDEGGDIPTFLHDLVLMSRAALLASVDPTMIETAGQTYDRTTVDALLQLAGRGSTPQFLQMVEILTAAERHLYRGAMMELPVEMAIVKIAGPSDQTPSPPGPPAATVSKPTVTKPKTTKLANRPTGGLELQSATQAWQEIQQNVQAMQPSLRLSVQQAWVGRVVGKTIFMNVPFELHRQRLTDVKNRHGLEDQLTEKIGIKVQLEIAVISEAPSVRPSQTPPPSKTQPQPATKAGELWDQVVASFS